MRGRASLGGENETPHGNFLKIPFGLENFAKKVVKSEVSSPPCSQLDGPVSAEICEQEAEEIRIRQK